MNKESSKRRKSGHLFSTAAEDLKNARQEVKEAEEGPSAAQVNSPAYRLAFDDLDFLVREELRPVRLLLELTKPELTLQEHKVLNTVVIFGSARTPSPEMVDAEQAQLDLQIKIAPRNPALLKIQKTLHFKRMQSRYYAEARRLAEIITERSKSEEGAKALVITGGGPGVMEAANRGAVDAGGESIGLNIVLPHEQYPNTYITPKFCFQFHYFAIRKMHFLLRARALVVFPGGFGTFDELFETLTLVQTGKIAAMPILVFGREFWEKVIDWNFMVEQGVISAEDLHLFKYVENAEEAWEYIKDSLHIE
ncbi:MAG: TIGR00730 family Rossman fold protein [Pseudomonadota bacterium]